MKLKVKKDIALEWTFYPFLEKPIRGALAVFIIILFIIFTYFITKSNILVIVSIIVLLITTASFFKIIKFSLSSSTLKFKSLGKTLEYNLEIYKSYYEKFPKFYLFKEEKPILMFSSQALNISFNKRDKKTFLVFKEYLENLNIKKLNK